MILTKDYFEENLARLQEHHPQAWQRVMDYTGERLGELCLAADGNPNLLIRKENGEEILLHDSNSPASELAGYNALVPETATGVAVFIGMGLGYTPPAMLASRSQLRHLVVVEPETGIFIRALQVLDLTSFLSDRRVNIAIGSDIDVALLLFPLARALQLESLYILRHLPSFQVAPEAYTKMEDEIYKYGNAYNVGGGTTVAYGGKFIDNRLRHLSAIHHQRLLEHLQDTFVGVPAIIVAGGPSLNKNIHLLPQAKGRAVIIAADTVLPALLAHGVTPDFTSAIDMQDLALEKIVDVATNASGTSLVCSSTLTSKVAKNFPARQVYWSFTAKNMDKWVNDLLEGKVLTTGAGTVAQLNFIVAHMLGCSPIIFVGQDLAFTEQESHAQHTALTDNEGMKGLFTRQEILWVDGYGGGKVPTSRAFLGFKHHFEACMAASKGRQFINATEGGGRLEGARELPLKEVLDRYCATPIDVAATIREAERRVRTPGRQRMINELSRMLKNIGGIEKEMTSLERLALKLSKEITEWREQGVAGRKLDMFSPALQGEFRELDALNASLDKARVWALLEEATVEGLRLSDRLNHEIQQLADQPEKFFEWLSKSINRIIVINQFRQQVLTPFTQQVLRLRNHLQRENFLLQKLINPKGKTRETALELLRFYYGSGEIVLLEKLIATHFPAPAESAELSFYLGAIAANRCQFEEMERNFAKSVFLDPSWSERIGKCRELLAGQYLDFVKSERSNQRLAQRMLFKAIRYTTEHAEVRQMSIAAASTILVEVKIVDSQEALAAMADQLSSWCQELATNANLVALLGTEMASSLYRGYGKALVAKAENFAAVQAFAAAIALAPEVPDLYLAHATAAFAGNDFDAGVRSLNRAVELDRQYAVYWGKLGDDLFAKGLPGDAVAAYEKCFMNLPAEINLLKKIGDCYLAMGQNEAALEAYRIYREKISAG